MWLTALLMGVAGSLHCAFMCSPLAMAATSFKGSAFVHRLAYNFGRTLTYALLGLVISFIGSVLQFSGFQTILSIILGVVLVVLGVAGISHLRVPYLSVGVQRLTIFVKKLFATFLQRRSFTSLTFLGMLNGLLPCGLTYLALTYCLTLTGVFDGFIFMMLFGIGTLPVMLGLTSFIQPFISRLLPAGKLTTYLMIILGTTLIIRSFAVHDDHAASKHDEDGIVICR